MVVWLRLVKTRETQKNTKALLLEAHIELRLSKSLETGVDRNRPLNAFMGFCLKTYKLIESFMTLAWTSIFRQSYLT